MPDGRIGDPAAADKTLLRFLTCGSVDDGKSTLIGRLLYNANVIMGDQLEALKAESRKFGTTGDDIDFSLLLDGLEDERQQRITIDVAYRYFSTPRRSFIVADSPGHEQYTRNMATGASTADLAILLVDARKGVLAQTRRHSLICSLLGIRHIVLAVNKMDLIGWDKAKFEAIRDEFHAFAARLDIHDVTTIPMSALLGDNVVTKSENKFEGLPRGTRAMQLPDNGFNASTYFLTVFGRPEASTSCECERSQDASLAQSLHLLNSKDVQDKLTSTNGCAAG